MFYLKNHVDFIYKQFQYKKVLAIKIHKTHYVTHMQAFFSTWDINAI